MKKMMIMLALTTIGLTTTLKAQEATQTATTAVSMDTVAGTTQAGNTTAATPTVAPTPTTTTTTATTTAPTTKPNTSANITPDMEARARAQTDKMSASLKLSESQKRDLYEANLQYMSELDDIKEETEAVKTKVDNFKDSHAQRLRTVLTEDQYKQYEALKDEQRDNSTKTQKSR